MVKAILVGQPNVGKSSLINAVSGAKLHVGNFTGVTVDYKEIRFTRQNEEICMVDLPGLYTLDAYSPEEIVSKDYIQNEKYDVIVNVIEANSIARGLNLTLELLELGKKMIVAINIIDEVEHNGGHIDCEGISKMLGCPVIGVSAKTREGIDKLEKKLQEMTHMGQPAPKPHYEVSNIATGRSILANQIVKINTKGIIPHKTTEKIDNLLMHSLLGLPIFLGIMWALFMITFTLGGYPQDYINDGFTFLSDSLKSAFPDGGNFVGIFTDGIIPAVGAVIGFLPNILILFLGIDLLEQTGYMSRAAFLLDGTLKRFGLHGKAFIPLITGLGCSIPAYMATRTLQNPIDKIVTMLVIGFFSCSARLPIYVLLLGTFFSPTAAGNLLFLIYFGGALLAFVVAKILRLALFSGESEPFALEMPRYRMPNFKVVLLDVYSKGKMFAKKAGTFIAGAAFLIWFLSAYPAVDDENMSDAQKLEQSYIGQIGQAIEPIFKPMGFSWQMSVATINALAAKEVAVSTLATLYSVGEEDENGLRSAIQKNISFASAMAFLVIVMIYSPCIAAISTFFQEVREWKYRAIYLIFPNILAWVLGFITYRILI